MKDHYFVLSDYLQDRRMGPELIDSMKEMLLIDLSDNTVWLSEKTKDMLGGKKSGLTPVISMDQFENCFSENTRITLRQEIQRLVAEKEVRVSFHAAVAAGADYLSTVLYLFRTEPEAVLGFLSVDYDPTKEYEQHLEEIIAQLQHAQTINELTLEGASDYIYQLDVVNNVCTFSSKAMDVLPLETPTFPDAMNRVLSFIIPEDRQVFLDSFTPFLTNQSDSHRAEYRVLTKQGTIMWISCHGKGIHDAEGRPVMIAGSLMDITERKAHEEEMRHMLYNDLLTGLKNRASFEQEFTERLKDENSRGSLLYIDIRRFKQYNELFGRAFGNLVLKEFAKTLLLYFPGALGVYRFVGNEFLVHLKDYNRQDILEKLTPFRAWMKQAREIDNHTFYINANIGVVIYPEHGRTTEELIKNADQCLYRMNRQATEEVAFFAAEVKDSLSLQFLLENELRKDIEEGYRHFRMVYQPIVETGPNGPRWIGAEALLRYNNPDLPNLPQMDLIRTLEYSGMIIPVGRWAISKAVHECSRWNKSGFPAIVHVNIAAQQVADAHLSSYIESCCQAENLPTSCLVAELTETSLVDDFGGATRFCENLMKLGINVALDDFGSGYSSFNYLQNLPLNEIKVDREYTRQLPENKCNQLIISFLRNFTHTLGLRLCVEGVETEDELELLRNMGIDLIQGFYFERPLESDVMRREFPSKAQSA